MIPLSYQNAITQLLRPSDSAFLLLMVSVIHRLRDVRLETVAEALPLPIKFESRRKKCSAS
ncbi:MAG: hypothetical protein AAF703_22495 [Cyanobacteria bacterium P01_D01_bin.105]